MDIANDGNAIGGYLEIDFGPRRGELYPQAKSYQSARAAFLALLQAGRPRRVWLPWYICESMVEQVKTAGIELVRYALNDDFSIAQSPELKSDDWLVYVNYFGLGDAKVKDVLDCLSEGQVVIDNSLALFSPPQDCLATIYSPRKFVGVPDGGYLLTTVPMELPLEEDNLSASRCLPLLVRAGGSAENGFMGWQDAQRSLNHELPKQMSGLTRRLLESVDYLRAAENRRQNFDALAAELSTENRLQIHRHTDSVPLNYAFAPAKPGLRQWLNSRRVYVPQFWPHLATNQDHLPAFERFLVNECVLLPCDQRYGPAHMARIVDLVRQHTANTDGPVNLARDAPP